MAAITPKERAQKDFFEIAKEDDIEIEDGPTSERVDRDIGFAQDIGIPGNPKTDDSVSNLVESLKKRRLPILLLLLQIVFLVFFAIFAKYDEEASPKFAKTIQYYDFPVRYGLFQDVHVMIFVGFGFLMTFLSRYAYSAVGFNFLLAALAIQWCLLVQGFVQVLSEGHFTLSIKSLIQADFGAAAVLISFGVLLGKTNPFQLCLMTLIELIFYSANAFICESKLGVVDAGGSILIHTFGAYFGLACSFASNHKWHANHPDNKPSYTNDIFSMVGTTFLWICWPTFNGALLDGFDQQHRVAINTLLSLAACVLATFSMSLLISGEGSLDMVHVQNATLAGGVAVGAVANFLIQPFGAILIGASAGLISVLGYEFLSPFLEKIGIHDTCGVNNLHGMPGLLSAFASIIAAYFASEDNYGEGLTTVFPRRGAPNFTETNSSLLEDLSASPSSGVSAGYQAGMQAAGLGATLGLALMGGVMSGLLIDLGLWRVEEEEGFLDSTNWKTPEEPEQRSKTPGMEMVSFSHQFSH